MPPRLEKPNPAMHLLAIYLQIAAETAQKSPQLQKPNTNIKFKIPDRLIELFRHIHPRIHLLPQFKNSRIQFVWSLKSLSKLAEKFLKNGWRGVPAKRIPEDCGRQKQLLNKNGQMILLLPGGRGGALCPQESPVASGMTTVSATKLISSVRFFGPPKWWCKKDFFAAGF